MKKKIICIFTLCLVLLAGCKSQKRIEKDVNAYVSDYNAGNINYDEAYADISSYYDDANDYEKESFIDQQLQLLQQLKESKDNFESGKSAFEKSNYEKAMEYLSLVIEADSQYEEAKEMEKTSQENFISAADEKAQSYLDDVNYLEAINVYQTAQSVYDDGSLDEKIANIEDDYRSYMEGNAETYIQNKEWGYAVTVYEALYDYFGDESYQTDMNDAKTNCVNEAVTEAEELLSQGNYTDAKEVLSTARSAIGPDGDLHAEEVRIEKFEPVKLTDMECDNEQIGEYLTVDEWKPADKDNFGNTGYSGLKISVSCASAFYYGDKSENVRYMSDYTLDGQYDTLTGVVAVNENSSDLCKEAGVCFGIVGDGEVLYSYGYQDSTICNEILNGDDKPVEFEIDISGVSELKIIAVSTNINSNSIVDYNTFTYGLLNFEVKKDYVAE